MWAALIRVRMSHSAWASSARSLMPEQAPVVVDRQRDDDPAVLAGSSTARSGTARRSSATASATDARRGATRIERVQAAVDLGDRELVVGGVLALDDPIHDPGLVADHPAEVAGIDRIDGDQRDRGLVEAALLEELREQPASTSGTSPFSTRTSSTSSGSAATAAATASPVPRGSAWRA